MNILQMMMARRMQQAQYGRRTNAAPAAAGCGCLSSIVGLAVTGAVLYGGYRVYDSTMTVVDDSMDQVDEMVDESLEAVQSGDVVGIDVEGTYTCDAGATGATATMEVTNTGAVEHTYDVSWQLFAVPTDIDVDLGDLGDLGDQFSTDALLEDLDDSFVLAPGESATRTYEAPDVTDENVGCGPPILTTDLQVPDITVTEDLGDLSDLGG